MSIHTYLFTEQLESRFSGGKTTALVSTIAGLDGLYAHLLTPRLPFPPRPGEALPTIVARMGLIRAKQRLLEKCTAHLRHENQFNRKIPINAELRALQQEIATLIRPLAVTL